MRLKLYANQRQLWLPLISSLVTLPNAAEVRVTPSPVAKVRKLSKRRNRNAETVERPSKRWDRNALHGVEFWEDEDILRCHAFLLERSAQELIDPRTSDEVQMEVIEWMNNDAAQGAFSFAVCCNLFGADHEVVRSEIFSLFEQQKRLN